MAQENNPSMPSWLASDEGYSPKDDRERFLKGNSLRLMGTLARVKAQRGGLEDVSALGIADRLLSRVDPAARLAGAIALIVCISAARNMFFVYCMLALVLAMLALKPAEDIADAIKPALGAALIACIIMLPAIFIGQPSSAVRIAFKVFLDVALLTQLSRDIAWSDLVAALRTFRLPSIVVFIFDIAIKYIVMLGEVALGVLDALGLRSVGRNPDKGSSASGVMGVTFLKAHDYAGEMYDAMECRGFVGDYEVPGAAAAIVPDIAYAALVAVALVAFFYLEGAL